MRVRVTTRCSTDHLWSHLTTPGQYFVRSSRRILPSEYILLCRQHEAGLMEHHAGRRARTLRTQITYLLTYLLTSQSILKVPFMRSFCIAT
jgi:hypothetical protein